SVQNFGRREGRGLVPTLLTGIRAVRRAERSDRAQEYVALSVRLARELLAVASLDEQIYHWCERFLGARVPPRRREQVLHAVEEGAPISAADVLSPSELFLMGQDYRLAAARPGRAPALTGAAASDTSSAGDDGDGWLAADSSVDSPAAIQSPLLERLR